jgi:hypothetical protein
MESLSMARFIILSFGQSSTYSDLDLKRDYSFVQPWSDDGAVGEKVCSPPWRDNPPYKDKDKNGSQTIKTVSPL